MKKYSQLVVGFLIGVLVTSIAFWSKGTIKTILRIPASDEAISQLLPPPQFSAKLPTVLQGNNSAGVKVSWEKVPDASAYSVLLTDQQGNLIKKYLTSDTNILLKDIPGASGEDKPTYKVFLASMNAKLLMGEKNEGRDLKITKKVSIVAPTVKQIIIED